ncbi:MAG: hypothetical protein ABT11_00200 [Novosphingobium sp. SCN 66-18]|nr:MAG: hypothetical protein ABT11_00200 [Novosphingobium sp. SCN 66-18]
MNGQAGRRHGLRTIAILASVAALGSMAIHMLVPALPLLAGELGLNPARAQQVVSVYLGGLACGQLIAGPVADRWGRRPVLLLGLACYVLGAAAGALAANFPLLLGARLLQAMGGAAGVVASRVMVGDLFDRAEAASRQATLMTIVLLSPAISPVIGGFVVTHSGWRMILGMLALVGGASFASSWLLLPETQGGGGSPASGSSTAHPSASSARLLKGYARLLSNPGFLLATGSLACASSSLYMFLGSAPFLLIRQFGLTPSQTGTALLAIAGAGIAGTRLVGPTARRGDALLAGTAIALGGTLLATWLAYRGIIGPVALVAPMTLLGVASGMIGPAAIHAAIFAEEGFSATAASLAGATQMLASGCAMAILGLFAPITPLRLALALLLTTGFAFCCALSRLLSAHEQRDRAR